MLDTDGENVAYLVMSFIPFKNKEEKLFAIPWQELKLNQKNRVFILNRTKEQLENAPGFDKNDWPKTGDSDFLGNVYDHFGLTRYWENY